MVDAARPQDLRDDVLDGVGRNGEPDPDVAGRARSRAVLDLRVDADDLAARVEQRAARVAGIDRGVGLDHVVDREAVRSGDEALERAHDSGGRGAVEPEGIPDRDDRIADADDVGVSDGEWRERTRRGLDAEHCEIRGRVGSDDLGLDRVAVREADGDLTRVAYDVVVRDDVAGLVDDEARSRAPIA